MDKINQRVKLTKQIFENTFAEMLMEMPFSRITIKELCRRAGLNRSTFYAHYADLNDLFDNMEQEFLMRISFFDTTMCEADRRKQIQAHASYIRQHKHAFIALLNNGRILRKFTLLSQKHNARIHPDSQNSNRQQQNYNLLTAYTVTGVISLLREWVEHAREISDEEIVDLILKLCDLPQELAE